eukprot:6347930-Prymnesium_polylepis.1
MQAAHFPRWPDRSAASNRAARAWRGWPWRRGGVGGAAVHGGAAPAHLRLQHRPRSARPTSEATGGEVGG